MTLTHSQARRYLEQSLHGPLPPSAQDRLQAHLRRCADCRAYAGQSARWHDELAQSLPALWPRRQANRAQLARTVERVLPGRGPRRPRFAATAHSLLQLALLLALVSAAFWYFDRLSGLADVAATPEDTAFVDPAFPNPQMAGEALAVRFDLDFNRLPGEEIAFYVPVCDGVEFVPSASALFRKLHLGQALPECSLQPSDTVLLAPGASQQVLLVYRNPLGSPVSFHIEPTSRTALSQPFAQALCGAPAGAGNACTTFQAPPHGIWARFVSFTAPSGARPGAHVTVTARVQWTRDGH